MTTQTKPGIYIPGYGNCLQIDQGGFGTVFEGFDQKNGCSRVAIKRISRSKFDNKQDERKADIFIRNEESIHGRLHHPSIVEKLNSFEDENFYYLVMEFCEKTVSKFVQTNGPLQEGLAKRLFYQIVLGVQYLHDEGIIHRDLKAGNILMKFEDGRWCAKIGDFGLAAVGNIHSTYVGTRPYMAPEIHSKKEYGKEVDIWSLGILLYYMLVGRIPYDIRNEHTSEEIAAIICNWDPDLSQVKCNSARNLIMTMLQRDPRARTTLKLVIKHDWLKSEDLTGGTRSFDSGHGVSLLSSKSCSSSPRNISTIRKKALDTINESGFNEGSSPSEHRSITRNKGATLRLPESSAPVIQLNTDGLKSFRMEYDDLPFVGSILESGEAVLEFLTLVQEGAHSIKRVAEVVRISRDGSMMYHYFPGNPMLGKKPPPLPDNPQQYYVSQLSGHDRARKKYSLAARFVDTVKSKTYKVLTVFESQSTGRAKCYLMRNEPNPNVETLFDDRGVKIVQTVDRVLVKSSANQKYCTYPLDKLSRDVPLDIQLYWDHHSTYREIVLDGDKYLFEQEKRAAKILSEKGIKRHNERIQMLSLKRSTDSSNLTSQKSAEVPHIKVDHTSYRQHSSNKSASGTHGQLLEPQRNAYEYGSRDDSSYLRRSQHIGGSHHSYNHVMTQSEPEWNRPPY